MDPHTQFCPNFYCLHRGKTGLGNIRVHSHRERRFRCTTCAKTFAATKNTPYYRLHTPLDLVTLVLTLLCHGCLAKPSSPPTAWTSVPSPTGSSVPVGTASAFTSCTCSRAAWTSSTSR